MKITERVERGSDRVVTQAKLTGILRLKNTSTNQTVRLVPQDPVRRRPGQPIKLEDARSEPTSSSPRPAISIPDRRRPNRWTWSSRGGAQAARLKESAWTSPTSPHLPRGDASHPVVHRRRPLSAPRMATTRHLPLRAPRASSSRPPAQRLRPRGNHRCARCLLRGLRGVCAGTWTPRPRRFGTLPIRARALRPVGGRSTAGAGLEVRPRRRGRAMRAA